MDLAKGISRLFFLACLAAQAIAAQAPGTRKEIGPDVAIRTVTTLIQVNVVAQDKNGQPVRDLNKEDFELLDRGKRQNIAVFIRETPPTGQQEPKPPTDFFSNRSNPDEARGGYSIILLDFGNTGLRNTERARAKAFEVVSKLPPSERVALYTFDSGGIHILSEIGADRSFLLEKLRKAVGTAYPCHQASLDGLPDIDSADKCGGEGPLAPKVKEAWMERRIRNTLVLFESLAEHLATLPGRKGLIWISAGFPAKVEMSGENEAVFEKTTAEVAMFPVEIDRAVRRLNNADVALYPIDSRGLSTESPLGRGEDYTAGVMDHFAKRTGGIAGTGQNGLDVLIRRAIEDVQVSYTLGFYAPQDAADAGFHALTVHALRQDVRLRYKEGYLAEPASPMTKARIKNDLSRALSAVNDTIQIPIDAVAERIQNRVRIQVKLQPAGLSLKQEDGRRRGEIELFFSFRWNGEEQPGNPDYRKVALSLTERAYELAARNGLNFLRTLAVPAKANEVRVLVRNPASGDIGTLTIPLGKVRQASP